MAAYCRVSSASEDQLASYQAQVQSYDRFIRSRTDYKLVGIFADEGISGTDIKKRTAFNQMMAHARAGQIDMIMTKSLSRFGRNTLDCIKCIRELKQLNVDVFFENENIHTSQSEGELLLTLISAVAQNESANQSENVKWGIRRKYERGSVRSIPSGKFLGYKKDEHGNLVIQEDQAQTIQRIYQACLDGLGTFQIAMMLTREQVPMAYGGKEWCASHILKVLTNEKYQGDTRFQKTYNTDYITKHRAKNKGQLPQPYLKDTHPAIIDRATWELVQLELARQKTFIREHGIDVYHRHCEAFPLSGKIFCSTCGRPYMILESKRVGESGRRYWRCSSFKGEHGLAIEGQLFTPKPHHRISTNPNVIRRHKDPLPRQMMCTDIEIDEQAPVQAFITAWNRLVEIMEEDPRAKIGRGDNCDLLQKYHGDRLMQLLYGIGRFDTMSYELMLKVLDHIEVGRNGRLRVIFLVGFDFEIG